jgi:hypothetical protein
MSRANVYPRGISQPARVIVGHCPACALVLVVQNGGETWPYVECSCGWAGATDAIANRARFERGGVLIDEHHPEPPLIFPPTLPDGSPR